LRAKPVHNGHVAVWHEEVHWDTRGKSHRATGQYRWDTTARNLGGFPAVLAMGLPGATTPEA